MKIVKQKQKPKISRIGLQYSSSGKPKNNWFSNQFQSIILSVILSAVIAGIVSYIIWDLQEDKKRKLKTEQIIYTLFREVENTSREYLSLSAEAHELLIFFFSEAEKIKNTNNFKEFIHSYASKKKTRSADYKAKLNTKYLHETIFHKAIIRIKKVQELIDNFSKPLFYDMPPNIRWEFENLFHNELNILQILQQQPSFIEANIISSHDKIECDYYRLYFFLVMMRDYFFYLNMLVENLSLLDDFNTVKTSDTFIRHSITYIFSFKGYQDDFQVVKEVVLRFEKELSCKNLNYDRHELTLIEPGP